MKNVIGSIALLISLNTACGALPEGSELAGSKQSSKKTVTKNGSTVQVEGKVSGSGSATASASSGQTAQVISVSSESDQSTQTIEVSAEAAPQAPQAQANEVKVEASAVSTGGSAYACAYNINGVAFKSSVKAECEKFEADNNIKFPTAPSTTPAPSQSQSQSISISLDGTGHKCARLINGVKYEGNNDAECAKINAL